MINNCSIYTMNKKHNIYIYIYIYILQYCEDK